MTKKKKKIKVYSSFGQLEYFISSVQSLSRVRLFATPWIAARQASLSITNSQSLLKPMSELVMPSNHLILHSPLLLLPQSLPASGPSPMSQLFAWKYLGPYNSTVMLCLGEGVKGKNIK